MVSFVFLQFAQKIGFFVRIAENAEIGGFCLFEKGEYGKICLRGDYICR